MLPAIECCSSKKSRTIVCNLDIDESRRMSPGVRGHFSVPLSPLGNFVTRNGLQLHQRRKTKSACDILSEVIANLQSGPSSSKLTTSFVTKKLKS